MRAYELHQQALAGASPQQGLRWAMGKNITKSEFEALRPANSDLITIERDGEYAYEIFLNYEGKQIAFSSIKTYSGEVVGYVVCEDDA